MLSGCAQGRLRRWSALIAVWVAFPVMTGEALAQRSIAFPRFDATIEVHEDASIEVREAIEVKFTGSWNGIYRRIPVEYRNNQGFSYRLFLHVDGVTDESGEALEHWVSEEGGHRNIKIRVPGAEDATRRVNIRYTVPNGLRFFDEHDELYWNVTGNEWDEPIQYATARLVLPEGVTGVRSAAYTGLYGSTEGGTINPVSSTELFAETENGLQYREGLTVVVGWDPGVVSRPGPLRSTLWFLRSNWMLLLPLGFLAFAHRAWSARGRDPKLGSIATEYEPPDGLRPAELGTLIDNTPHIHDITSTLVDLAVRGFLRIEQTTEKKFFRTEDHVTFVLVRAREDWLELLPYEHKMLDEMFKHGTDDEVSLDDLKNTFYTAIPAIRDRIFDKLIQRGYYVVRPDKVRARWLTAAAMLTFLLPVLGIVLAQKLFLSPLTAVVAGVLSALPIWIFGWNMPARTVEGVKTLGRVLGFEEFLSRVDGDRLRTMDMAPDMFERFLPYAMALNVEDRWAAAFEDIAQTPPNWYTGPVGHHFHPSGFTDSLSTISRTTSSALQSQPRSSSSSGFGGGGGGGGFSGGGGGGGGGGGW